MSRMQPQCHVCNGNSRMHPQYHACNGSSVTHAAAAAAAATRCNCNAAVVAICVCSSNNAHAMLLMQCAHMSSRKTNCGILLGILSHASEKPACS